MTRREHDIIGLMAEGRSNAGISAALFISGGAVEKHVDSIFGKLGLPPSEGDNRRGLPVLRYVGATPLPGSPGLAGPLPGEWSRPEPRRSARSVSHSKTSRP